MERPYTNIDMYNDIKNMLSEVKNPKDDKTQKLLEVAAVEFRKADQSGSDECVDYFIAKYPLLAQNCPKIFREAILVNRDLDLDMVRRALNYQEKMESGELSRKRAEENFGFDLANRFFPEAAKAEMTESFKDPKKMMEAREKVRKAFEKERKTT